MYYLCCCYGSIVTKQLGGFDSDEPIIRKQQTLGTVNVSNKVDDAKINTNGNELSLETKTVTN